MQTEYVIWGKSAKSNHADAILYTQAKDMAHATRVMEALAKDHGCYEMRVQTIDFSRDISDDWRTA